MEPKCLSYSAPRRLSLSISVLFLSLSPPSCQCTVGSQVAMRVGGDFFFDPSPSDPTVNLLLVAGGVGINPLYSILLHATDLLHLNHASGGLDYNIGSVNLCYSAKNTQELLFKVCYIIFHCWNIFFCIFFFFYFGLQQCPHVCLQVTVLLQYVSRNCIITYLLCFQSSIVEVCREFPDKFSCDFYVTQQSTDVDPHLQPFLHRE